MKDFPKACEPPTVPETVKLINGSSGNVGDINGNSDVVPDSNITNGSCSERCALLEEEEDDDERKTPDCLASSSTPHKEDAVIKPLPQNGAIPKQPLQNGTIHTVNVIVNDDAKSSRAANVSSSDSDTPASPPPIRNPRHPALASTDRRSIVDADPLRAADLRTPEVAIAGPSVLRETKRPGILRPSSSFARDLNEADHDDEHHQIAFCSALLCNARSPPLATKSNGNVARKSMELPSSAASTPFQRGCSSFKAPRKTVSLSSALRSFVGGIGFLNGENHKRHSKDLSDTSFRQVTEERPAHVSNRASKSLSYGRELNSTKLTDSMYSTCSADGGVDELTFSMSQSFIATSPEDSPAIGGAESVSFQPLSDSAPHVNGIMSRSCTTSALNVRGSEDKRGILESGNQRKSARRVISLVKNFIPQSATCLENTKNRTCTSFRLRLPTLQNPLDACPLPNGYIAIADYDNGSLIVDQTGDVVQHFCTAEDLNAIGIAYAQEQLFVLVFHACEWAINVHVGSSLQLAETIKCPRDVDIENWSVRRLAVIESEAMPMIYVLANGDSKCCVWILDLLHRKWQTIICELSRRGDYGSLSVIKYDSSRSKKDDDISTSSTLKDLDLSPGDANKTLVELLLCDTLRSQLTSFTICHRQSPRSPLIPMRATIVDERAVRIRRVKGQEWIVRGPQIAVLDADLDIVAYDGSGKIFLFDAASQKCKKIIADVGRGTVSSMFVKARWLYVLCKRQLCIDAYLYKEDLETDL